MTSRYCRSGRPRRGWGFCASTVGDNELRDTSIFRETQNPKSKIPKSITQLHFILLCTVNMPAREINLNPFKDHIIAWFNDGMSSEEITERLANDHNIVCTNRTIKRRLKI